MALAMEALCVLGAVVLFAEFTTPTEMTTATINVIRNPTETADP